MISRTVYDKWMERTQMEKIEKILEHVKPEGSVLDVGSGPGFFERFVDAVATDIDIENLRKTEGLKMLCSGDKLPFKDKSFDWVFCIDAVHNLRNADELKRVGKKLVVSLFCNEHNAEERLKELYNIGDGETFIVKTEKEWDAVLVLVP